MSFKDPPQITESQLTVRALASTWNSVTEMKSDPIALRSTAPTTPAKDVGSLTCPSELRETRNTRDYAAVGGYVASYHSQAKHTATGPDYHTIGVLTTTWFVFEGIHGAEWSGFEFSLTSFKMPLCSLSDRSSFGPVFIPPVLFLFQFVLFTF
jgi:hypothetical protein